jgi:hypothetical protein
MGRIIALAALALAASAQAGDGRCSRWWDVFCPGRLKLPLCCPDDYCEKPKPPLPPDYCPCGCDDYCPKPPPWLPAEFKPCGCDDYVPKPPVELPCDAPGKCHPTDGCGPKEKCWWLRGPWWGKRLCDAPGCPVEPEPATIRGRRQP